MGSMAHEEHTGGGNGGGGGGRSSKKIKHDKVPQRGMGVAQLERMITERQLKDAGISTSNSVKFRLPEVPLPPPFPNRHPLVSKSRLYNIDGGNSYPYQYQYQLEPNTLTWPQFHAKGSSMVNVSLGATSSSSIMSNIQIEPPSNQSYCANKHTSYQPDGDKMVGMKRPYPFSMENIPPAYLSPISKPDESTTCRRENLLSLGDTKDQKAEKFIEENLAKDFLTLAPPQASPPSHSRLKEKVLPSSAGELTRPSDQVSSFLDLSSVRSGRLGNRLKWVGQGQTRDSSETEWSNQHALHSFFPAAKTHGIGNGEVGEHVDLNLKL
ncbi:putative SPEAR family protein [Helianthus annuus]|nr:putative SPEAR family protein [Helianthus annuus]